MYNFLKKYRKFFLSSLVTFGIFVCLFNNISFSKVVYTIEKSNKNLIVLTLVISFLSNILIAAYRWKKILNKFNYPVSFGESLLIKMGSDPIISFVPFRAGEFFRALYLRRLRNIPYRISMFSIIVEYLFNLVMLFVFFLTGLFFCFKKEYIFSYIFLPAFVFMGSFQNNLVNNNSFFLKQIKHLLDFKKMKKIYFNPLILFLTFLFMGSELVNVYLLAKALGISIGFMGLFLYLPIIIVISILPLTLLGMGIRELCLLFFFGGYASSGSILSLGLLYSFIEHVFPMLIGSLFTFIVVKRVWVGGLGKDENN